MKKILICMFICCCLLVSCNSSNPEKDEGEFRGVVPASQVGGGIPVKYAIDEEMALEIGNAILKKIFGEEVIKNTRFIVCEVDGKDYFVVSRLPKNYEMGGDFGVAINKEDGKILKVWMGE